MNNLPATFEFEACSIRIIMVAADPWWVASDLAKALGYRDAPNMIRNLDDDQRGTHLVSTPSGDQDMTIINEGGMWTAVIKSRSPAAKRFQRWLTDDLLPTLRKTGRYVLFEPDDPVPALVDIDTPRLSATVAVVREARRLFGPRAARGVWHELGLPRCITDAEGSYDGDPLALPLRDWLAERDTCVIAEAVEAVGLPVGDKRSMQRIGALMRLMGWINRKVRDGDRTYRRWFANDPQAGED